MNAKGPLKYWATHNAVLIYCSISARELLDVLELLTEYFATEAERLLMC